MSRALWLRLFGDWGWDAVGAGDGDSAVAVATGETFDAMICDIVLPGRNGVEAIAEVRRRRPEMMIIAISGTEKIGGELFRSQAHEAGADSFMFKPVEPYQLLAEFKRLEEERCASQRA